MPIFNAPHVTKIEPLPNLLIRIEWQGQSKTIDLSDSDIPERFPKLKETSYFMSAHLEGGAIAWPDGLHLDLDELIYDLPDVDIPQKGIVDRSDI